MRGTDAVTASDACQVLSALGFSADEQAMIRGEVLQRAQHVPRTGALELADLWLTALQAAWQARERRPQAGGGYLRLCVRGALRDALWAEWRACGRVPLTMLWPWYYPRRSRPCVDCGEPFGRPHARRCGRCSTIRYRARRQGRAAA